MKTRRNQRRGFGLTDLVVASAAVGMLLLLGAPALKKGQAGVDQRRCLDNLRQLSQAQLTFEMVNGGLPPMAMSFTSQHYQANQPGPGSWYDGHGWYSFIAPYIGEPQWASTLNLSVSMSSNSNFAARRGGLRLKVHACPADIGLQRSEWGSNTWARVLSNYVVNAGNTQYGQNDAGFLGAPFAGGVTTPLATITDGLSTTLLMSEKVVIQGCPVWSGSYAEIQSSLGGQVFTARNPPNPTTADGIGYGRNGNGDCTSTAVMDARYAAAGVVPVPIQLSPPVNPYATYLSARSKHPGGVNATMCDGSGGFVASNIDPAVWRALSTARGADAVTALAKAPVKGK